MKIKPYYTVYIEDFFSFDRMPSTQLRRGGRKITDNIANIDDHYGLKYVKDDGGRAEAGFKGRAKDCAVRALSIYTGEPYEKCYNDIAEANQRHHKSGKRSCRYGTNNTAMKEIYEKYGLKRIALPRKELPTYEEVWRTYGNCIVRTTKHVCALVDGALHDTFDGRAYSWEDNDGEQSVKFRKARSIWKRD